MTNDNKRSLPRANFDRPIVGAKRDFEQYTNKIAIATGGGWTEGSFGGPTNQPKSNFVPIHINPKRRISARARAIEQNTDTHRHIESLARTRTKTRRSFAKVTDRLSATRANGDLRTRGGLLSHDQWTPFFPCSKGAAQSAAFKLTLKLAALGLTGSSICSQIYLILFSFLNGTNRR